jgi:putative transposase
VLNRAVGRMRIFAKERDFEAFEEVIAEAKRRLPMRVLAWCVLSNHWHFVLWPRGDGDLSEFMRWLTVTHTQRWHAGRSEQRSDWVCNPRCVLAVGRASRHQNKDKDPFRKI